MLMNRLPKNMKSVLDQNEDTISATFCKSRLYS